MRKETKDIELNRSIDFREKLSQCRIEIGENRRPAAKCSSAISSRIFKNATSRRCLPSMVSCETVSSPGRQVGMEISSFIELISKHGMDRRTRPFNNSQPLLFLFNFFL